MRNASTEAYPLSWPSGWPRNKHPGRSQYKQNSAHVTQLAMRNAIRMLGGTQLVVSANVRLRNDGMPYANDRQPDDRGVAVYFLLKGKQMVFACDQWDRVHDNMHSIRLTIDALRGIERWGASDMMERAFNGFLTLPEPANQLVPKDCWQTLEVAPFCKPEDLTTARRKMALRYHPDMGEQPDSTRMAEINAAFSEAMRLVEA